MSASYPTSAKAFTAKNNGDSIQAAHIDDLQDEVSAIETGLLGSLAHDLKFTDATYDIGKSGATRPRDLFLSRNLTVGTSATIQALTVNGAFTVADLSVTAPPPSARVTATTSQNINTGVGSAVTFDSDVWATTTGLHSTSANPTRLLMTSSGIWSFFGNVSWQGGSTGAGVCSIGIRIDGSSVVAQTQDKDPSGLIQTVAVDYYARSTAQYAELIATQNSGSTKSIAVSSDFSPVFSATKRR